MELNLNALIRRAAMVLVSLACLPVFAAEPTPVWLDVDPAAGIPDSDVDDALALIQAFHSPELAIRGVSVVYGNAPHDEGLPIAREVARLFGPEGLAVYPGASSAEELGAACPAVDALAKALAQEPLTLLALGPLTNVGTLLQRHPELQEQIERIVVVAGRRPGQRITPNPELAQNFRDFNFENDPEAMRVILESKVPLVLAPWEVSSHVWLTAADLESIRSESSAGAWIAEKSQGWLGMWRDKFQRDGFNPFDTLAIAWATHPQMIDVLPVTVSIQSGPDDTQAEGTATEGATKPYLLVDPGNLQGRAATYCYRPHDTFKPMLLRRLVAPPQPAGVPGQ